MIKENHFFNIRNVVSENFKAHKSNIKEVFSSDVNNTNQNLDIAVIY